MIWNKKPIITKMNPNVDKLLYILHFFISFELGLSSHIILVFPCLLMFLVKPKKNNNITPIKSKSNPMVFKVL